MNKVATVEHSPGVELLVDCKIPAHEIINELYVATLGRMPTDEETETAREALRHDPPAIEAVEDLLFALMVAQDVE